MPVWKEAFEIALRIHAATANFPRAEDYGLTSQLRRAAVSSFSNIAEGFGRSGTKEKRRFYNIAKASMMEVQAQLSYASAVGYLSRQQVVSMEEKIFPWFHEMNKLIKTFSQPQP